MEKEVFEIFDDFSKLKTKKDKDLVVGMLLFLKV